MKPMKLLAVLVPVLLGLAAALWTPLALWYDMKEGLIAFLGFLAASLMQVMPLTANFLQSDRLSPSEAERLTASLTKQQHYWIGLLSATIAAMVIVIVGSALKERVTNLAPAFEHRLFMEVGWSAVVCFFIASSVSFVLVKMLGLFEGMLSLHRLRVELVINSAKREAAYRAAAIQKEAEVSTPLVPPDYGKVVRPH
jgi:hypothetical protein